MEHFTLAPRSSCDLVHSFENKKNNEVLRPEPERGVGGRAVIFEAHKGRAVHVQLDIRPNTALRQLSTVAQLLGTP